MLTKVQVKIELFRSPEATKICVILQIDMAQKEKRLHPGRKWMQPF